MASRRDPVQEAAGSEFDLYEVATWEPRNQVDRLATTLYWLGSVALRAFVILLALAILLSQIVLGSIGVVQDRPLVLIFALFSVVPALAIAAYIWHGDVTRREPLGTLVATFVLAVLFAPAIQGASRYAEIIGDLFAGHIVLKRKPNGSNLELFRVAVGHLGTSCQRMREHSLRSVRESQSKSVEWEG